MNVVDLLTEGKEFLNFFTGDELSEVEAKAIANGKVEIAKFKHKSEKAIVEAQASTILADAQGEGWLQRSWRPLLMVSFGLIIFISYGLFPIINAVLSIVVEPTIIEGKSILLQIPPVVIPDAMWDLLTVGVSGYIVGRSIEKSLQIKK